MKKLIFLLMFPIIGFGQNVNLNVEKKVEFTEKKDVKRGLGLNYQGSGLYTLSKSGSQSVNGSVNPSSKMERFHLEIKNKVVQEINEFTATNNYDYKITLVEKLKYGPYPLIVVTFKVFNKDGSLVLSKDDAKKQLLELKGYLDLGIITQEEYDKSAAPYKKILLVP
jgi:hypothetical protein